MMKLALLALVGNVASLDTDYHAALFNGRSLSNVEECVQWSRWYDRDNPSGTGDWEDLVSLRKQYPRDLCLQGDIPFLQVRSISDGFPVNLEQLSDFNVISNPAFGFACRSTECDDYEVAFCCDRPEPKPQPSCSDFNGNETLCLNTDCTDVGSLDGNDQTTKCIWNQATYICGCSPCNEQKCQLLDANAECIRAAGGCPDGKTCFDDVCGSSCLCAIPDGTGGSDPAQTHICEGGEWSTWFDRDQPSGTGDWETVVDQEKLTGSICRDAEVRGIWARTVVGHVDALDNGEVISFINPVHGFACERKNQPDRTCDDYEVRYCCKPAHIPVVDTCANATSMETCARVMCADQKAPCQGVVDGEGSFTCSCPRKGCVTGGTDCDNQKGVCAPECLDSDDYTCDETPGICGIGASCLCSVPKPADTCRRWTSWLDRDNPSGTGDWETLNELRREYTICETPTAIQVSPLPGSNSGVLFQDPVRGFACLNSAAPAGRCDNYEVRFCCPPDEDKSCLNFPANSCAADQKSCRDNVYGCYYENEACKRCPVASLCAMSRACEQEGGKCLDHCPAEDGVCRDELCLATGYEASQYEIGQNRGCTCFIPTQTLQCTQSEACAAKGASGHCADVCPIGYKCDDSLCDSKSCTCAWRKEDDIIPCRNNAQDECLGARCPDNPELNCVIVSDNSCGCPDVPVPTACDWEPWGYNRDLPSGTGDWETIAHMRSPPCDTIPSGIQARDSSTLVAAELTGEYFSHYDTVVGFVCRNNQQADGRCNDYEVRFCCDIKKTCADYTMEQCISQSCPNDRTKACQWNETASACGCADITPKPCENNDACKRRGGTCYEECPDGYNCLVGVCSENDSCICAVPVLEPTTCGEYGKFDSCVRATCAEDSTKKCAWEKESSLCSCPDVVVQNCKDWTNWLDRDNPSGDGDWEDLANAQQIWDVCQNPTGIEARIRTADGSGALAQASDPGIAFYNVVSGFACRNVLMPEGLRCPDYEVRFCCDEQVTSCADLAEDTCPNSPCPAQPNVKCQWDDILCNCPVISTPCTSVDAKCQFQGGECGALSECNPDTHRCDETLCGADACVCKFRLVHGPTNPTSPTSPTNPTSPTSPSDPCDPATPTPTPTAGDWVSSYQCQNWKGWYNVDDPSGASETESLELARSDYDESLCANPVIIEARRARDGMPALQTGDYFQFYNVEFGLLCVNKDQPDALCDDYEVRYCCDAPTSHTFSKCTTFTDKQECQTCPSDHNLMCEWNGKLCIDSAKCSEFSSESSQLQPQPRDPDLAGPLQSGCREWTQWFDRDDPSGTGDWETLSDLRRQYKICDGRVPSGIDGANLSGGTFDASNVTVFDPATGLVCLGIGCADYAVRFCCDVPAEPTCEQVKSKGLCDTTTCQRDPDTLCKWTDADGCACVTTVVEPCPCESSEKCDANGGKCMDETLCDNERFLCNRDLCTSADPDALQCVCQMAIVTSDLDCARFKHTQERCESHTCPNDPLNRCQWNKPAVMSEAPRVAFKCNFESLHWGISARTWEVDGNRESCPTVEVDGRRYTTDMDPAHPQLEDKILAYCLKFYPETSSVELEYTSEMLSFGTAVNATYATWSCIQATCDCPTTPTAAPTDVGGASKTPTGSPTTTDVEDPPCNGTWTSYESRDYPSGTGDWETTEHAIGCPAGEVILGIDGRTKSFPHISAGMTGEVLLYYDIVHGLICLNQVQPDGRCLDYQVRWCCGAESPTPHPRSCTNFGDEDTCQSSVCPDSPRDKCIWDKNVAGGGACLCNSVIVINDKCVPQDDCKAKGGKCLDYCPEGYNCVPNVCSSFMGSQDCFCAIPNANDYKCTDYSDSPETCEKIACPEFEGRNCVYNKATATCACPDSSPALLCENDEDWSAWLDRDDPSGTGDWEHLGGFAGIVCDEPTAIEARVRGTQEPASATGEVFTYNSPSQGFACINGNQPASVGGVCSDYEVRFCCPKIVEPPKDCTVYEDRRECLLSSCPQDQTAVCNWLENEDGRFGCACDASGGGGGGGDCPQSPDCLKWEGRCQQFVEAGCPEGFLCKPDLCEGEKCMCILKTQPTPPPSLEPTLAPTRECTQWSDWHNRDTPDGTGDWEILSLYTSSASSQQGDPCGNGQVPSAIQGWSVTTTQLASVTGDIFKFYSPSLGLACLYSLNGKRCEDYEVRYCCDAVQTTPTCQEHQTIEACRTNQCELSDSFCIWDKANSACGCPDDSTGSGGGPTGCAQSDSERRCDMVGGQCMSACPTDSFECYPDLCDGDCVCGVEATVCKDWTQWMSRDLPSGSGDWELLIDLRRQYTICEAPTIIEVRNRATKTPALDSIPPGPPFALYSASQGFACVHKPPAYCEDYEVRFCCDDAMLDSCNSYDTSDKCIGSVCPLDPQNKCAWNQEADEGFKCNCSQVPPMCPDDSTCDDGGGKCIQYSDGMECPEGSECDNTKCGESCTCVAFADQTSPCDKAFASVTQLTYSSTDSLFTIGGGGRVISEGMTTTTADGKTVNHTLCCFEGVCTKMDDTTGLDCTRQNGRLLDYVWLAEDTSESTTCADFADCCSTPCEQADAGNATISGDQIVCCILENNQRKCTTATPEECRINEGRLLGSVDQGLSCADFAECCSGEGDVTEPPTPASPVCDDWSQWYNRDLPSGSGDWELLSLQQKIDVGLCEFPTAIEAVSTSGVPAEQTGQSFVHYNTITGFACINSHNAPRGCLDYRVRFCCDVPQRTCTDYSVQKECLSDTCPDNKDKNCVWDGARCDCPYIPPPCDANTDRCQQAGGKCMETCPEEGYECNNLCGRPLTEYAESCVCAIRIDDPVPCAKFSGQGNAELCVNKMGCGQRRCVMDADTFTCGCPDDTSDPTPCDAVLENPLGVPFDTPADGDTLCCVDGQCMTKTTGECRKLALAGQAINLGDPECGPIGCLRTCADFKECCDGNAETKCCEEEAMPDQCDEERYHCHCCDDGTWSVSTVGLSTKQVCHRIQLAPGDVCTTTTTEAQSTTTTEEAQSTTEEAQGPCSAFYAFDMSDLPALLNTGQTIVSVSGDTYSSVPSPTPCSTVPVDAKRAFASQDGSVTSVVFDSPITEFYILHLNAQLPNDELTITSATSITQQTCAPGGSAGTYYYKVVLGTPSTTVEIQDPVSGQPGGSGYGFMIAECVDDGEHMTLAPDSSVGAPAVQVFFSFAVFVCVALAL